MGAISRRRALIAFGGSAAALGGLEWTVPGVASAADVYETNSELYEKRVEGVDFARRYRRHAAFDDSPSAATPLPGTVILALHGGGIEPGTSELCLAVAGYHPATMTATPPLYDYWMLEGLLDEGNSALHVTSTRCDDPVARPLVAGSARALSLHGCTPTQAKLPAGTPGVVVGGLDTALKARLMDGLAAAGLRAPDDQGQVVDVAVVDGTGVPALGGDHPDNIANRTFGGAGAQLELTTPLRAKMFGTNTASRRKYTTNDLFDAFVATVRAALD